MKNTLETRLGLFFALAIIAAVILLEMIGVADFFKGGYRIYANFKNIQELKEGDPVKIAGVEKGRVSQVELIDREVRVTMKMDKDAQVRTDSKATIKFTGLMGQNYIAVDFGTTNGLLATEGTTIASAEQPDLSTLMVKLENVASGIEGLTKNFSLDSLSTMFGPLTDFVKQNGPALTAVIGNMKSVSEQVASGQGTVGRLLYDETLYNATLSTVTNFQSASGNIQGLITQTQGMLDNINRGQGTLGKLATDDTLYQETATAMSNLRDILQKINRGEGSAGKLVNDDTFYKNAKLTLQKVDKATEGLEDQGPLSVLGIAVNSLF